MVLYQICRLSMPRDHLFSAQLKTEAYHSRRVSHNESVTTRRLDVSTFNLVNKSKNKVPPYPHLGKWRKRGYAGGFAIRRSHALEKTL
jgi:hypothetical protein